MIHPPTEEQLAIIHHPMGKHARVLAVAGSGKTTTMVGRVCHLVQDLQQDPRHIRVVMFNRLAREDFQRKLNGELPEAKQPRVTTFHSLAFSMRQDAQKQGLMVQYKESWTGDKEEKALVCMHRAIEGLRREGILQEDVDPGEALDAVGLWKASLIPPERAGHRTSLDLPLVYRRFEYLREQAGALTFDDFVPKALDFMDSNPLFRARFANQLDHLIVDEYQDVNYGQQELIKLLAGTRADVMVVGDDDQTIYEWRAARPEFILNRFKQGFSNREVLDYTLSHSFRFGPVLAQCAYNVITQNSKRETKPLVAHDVGKQTGISVWVDDSEQSTQVAFDMAQEILTLVRRGVLTDQNQKPNEKPIIVLGRTFTQFEGLEAIFIGHKIPFRVLGMAPFFERDENRTLIDYIRLAQAWDLPVGALKPWRTTRKPTQSEDEEEPAQARTYRYSGRSLRLDGGEYSEATRTLQAIANTPNRRIARSVSEALITNAGQHGLTIGEAIGQLVDDRLSPLPADRRETAQELVDFLRRLRERLNEKPLATAGELLSWMIETLNYERHFVEYYGQGQASWDRLSSIRNFIRFAGATGLEPITFVNFLGNLDTTQGLDTEHVITMTTAHRTKGLEYRFVFLPSCIEGYMPLHYVDEMAIFDTAGIVPDQPLSPPIESERRLFYVAATRAKEHLYIGTIIPPERGQQGNSSSPLPSRFLEEMRHTSTQALITALQEVVAAGGAETSVLHNALRQHPYDHSVLRYAMEKYAGDLPDGLPAWLEEAIAATPDAPFTYSYAYPSLGELRKSKDPDPDAPKWAKQKSVDPWADIGITL